MNDELSAKRCTPCHSGTPALSTEHVTELAAKLDEGWAVIDWHHLEKEYKFENFREALDFTVSVGELAEREGHHPEILLGWGKAKVTIWTHKIDGLSVNDFILAAKIDE